MKTKLISILVFALFAVIPGIHSQVEVDRNLEVVSISMDDVRAFKILNWTNVSRTIQGGQIVTTGDLYCPTPITILFTYGTSSCNGTSATMRLGSNVYDLDSRSNNCYGTVTLNLPAGTTKAEIRFRYSSSLDEAWINIANCSDGWSVDPATRGLWASFSR